MDSISWKLRPAKESDALNLSHFAENTFRNTFDQDNTVEDMKMYVARAFNELKIRSEIAEPARTTVLALVDEKIVGYYQLFKGIAEPSIQSPNPIELVRLYIDATYKGQGLAAALMEDVLGFAKANGYKTLWLGVWEKNFRAQSFYKKWGFEKVGDHEFVLGTDVQNDWILSRRIE